MKMTPRLFHWTRPNSLEIHKDGSKCNSEFSHQYNKQFNFEIDVSQDMPGKWAVSVQSY